MVIYFISSILVAFVLEKLYFRIAAANNIIDKTNERSSHNYITIRGGGIICAVMAAAATVIFPYPGSSFFIISLLMLGGISFLDDIYNLGSTIRLSVQVLSVLIVLFSGYYHLEWYYIVILFLLFTYVINAYNFMDGINGITALYSIVTIGALYWANVYVIKMLPDEFFLSQLAGLLIFSFFNVRKRAKCFAGDVGSVSLAFIICFLITRLAVQTGYWPWVCILGVYLIDSGFTICARMIRREALMEAHRSHFYQFLVNEAGWKHVSVSILYAGVQVILNIITIYSQLNNLLFLPLIFLLVVFIIYTTFRFLLEGRDRLFVKY